MTQVHYMLPPELEKAGAIGGLGETEKLCLICLLRAKGRQVEKHQPTWRPLLSDGRDHEQKWIAFDVKSPIREAVALGIHEMFPGVRIPLCWDDMGAIGSHDPGPPCPTCHGTGEQPASQIQQASGPLPPAFRNGRRNQG